MFETWYKMAAMIQGGLDTGPIITHHFPIDDFKQGFEVMGSGKSGKVILDWGVKSQGRARSQTAAETDAMLKSWLRSAGTYQAPPHSLETRVTAAVIASQFESRFTGDSFQRKLFTGPVTRPSSMRKTPSRVSPVADIAFGSSQRE